MMSMVRDLCFKRLIAASVIALEACAARGSLGNPRDLSHVYLSPKDVTMTAVAEGKDCVSTPFIVIPFTISQPSYLDAQLAAQQTAGADILLDEVGYQGFESGFVLPTPFGLFGYAKQCVYVEGVGARLAR